jgi:dephospho-CoA kinase
VAPKKPVIGLIGGIGSGKSRVSELLARRGARVLSGDQAGHEALRQPEVKARVVERWGPGVLDESGAVDRRRLAARVFADPAERRALEAIVWPWIGRRLRDEVEAAQADPAVKFVLLDAAVLLEAGWDDVCDRLVYVDAPREVRLRRLAEQRGWSAEELAARERAQLALTEKARRADDVLDNSGPPEALARQVDDLLQRWGVAP